MKARLGALALAGLLALGGCSSDNDDVVNGGSVIPPGGGTTTSLGRQNQSSFTIPPGGGAVEMPPTQEMTGTFTFAPGASPGTTMTVKVSETPVAGAIAIPASEAGVSTQAFYYLTLSVDKPFDLDLLDNISLIDRPNDVTIVPAEAEQFSMPVAEVESGQVLQHLPGDFDPKVARFTNTQPHLMQAGKSYLLQAQATDTPSMDLFLKNDSEFPYAYYTLYGQNGVNATDPRFYHVEDGQLVPMKAADRFQDTLVPLGDNRFGGYCNYSHPIATGGNVTKVKLPLLRAGRLFVALTDIDPANLNNLTANNTTSANVRQLLLIRTNDFTPPPPSQPQPSPGTYADPALAQPNGWGLVGQIDYNSLFDWVEFDYTITPDSKQPGMGVNKTEVDMFGFGLQINLQGPTTGSRTVGTNPDGRKKTFDALEADPVFSKLLVSSANTPIGNAHGLKYLRAIAPVQGINNVLANQQGGGTFNTTYLDSYINNVWNFYKTNDLTVFTSAFGTYSGRVNSNDELVLGLQDYPSLLLKKPTTKQAFEPTDYQSTKAFYSPSPGASPIIVPPPPPGVPAPVFPSDPNKSRFTPFVATETVSAISACFNRSTLLLEKFLTRDYANHPATLGFFFNTKDGTGADQPVNQYARNIHANALPTTAAPGTPPSGGAAYAFGFDDNMNQSSFIADNRTPTNMTITVTKVNQ